MNTQEGFRVVVPSVYVEPFNFNLLYQYFPIFPIPTPFSKPSKIEDQKPKYKRT